MQLKKSQLKIAWGITGSGHFLSSSLEIIQELDQVDLFLSKAAQEVIRAYHFYDKLPVISEHLYLDSSASAFPVTRLYTGHYQAVVIAPVTGNSIAKMAFGIADNLITNLFAHAGKCQIPIILLPCDSKPEISSLTPQGTEVSVHTRKVDLENIERLAGWPGVKVATNPEQLKSYLSQHLKT